PLAVLEGTAGALAHDMGWEQGQAQLLVRALPAGEGVEDGDHDRAQQRRDDAYTLQGEINAKSRRNQGEIKAKSKGRATYAWTSAAPSTVITVASSSRPALRLTKRSVMALAASVLIRMMIS